MTNTSTLPSGVLPGGRFRDWAPRRTAYVVCDVDGTLVGPQDLASSEVADAITRAQAAGVRVGFATGRMRDAVGALNDQLGAAGPHLLHNGAEIRAGGRTIASWTLAPDQVEALLEIARARDDAYVEIYTESGFHVSSWEERARPHWQLLRAEPTSVLESAAQLRGAPVLKATFAVFEPAAADDISQLITAAGLMAGSAGSPRTPELTYVNATRRDADKGRALVRAASHLGVPMAAVAAVGDATNDLSMLEVAGTAIAMGQSPRSVVAAADLVVPDVDAHGVAVALDTLVGWQARRDDDQC